MQVVSAQTIFRRRLLFAPVLTGALAACSDSAGLVRAAATVVAIFVASCGTRSAEEEVRPIPACEALLSTQRTCLERAGAQAASRVESQIAAMRKSLYTEAAKGPDARTATAARCVTEEARVRTSCR
ncbi:MAG TPA: hypothetical protein VM580_24970 [Labilithrix sp.]|nr:hypothetical protein [Labilithrix sp.]